MLEKGRCIVILLTFIISINSVHGRNLHRYKRQNFDFSMNTPKPKPLNNSQNSNFSMNTPELTNTTSCEDECMTPSDFCKNGGTCSFDPILCSICSCPDEFTGKTCETRKQNNQDLNKDFACFFLTCINGGKRVDTDTECYCNCTDEYTGGSCEIKIADITTSGVNATTGTTTTLRPESERICDGFECFHGICNVYEGKYTCDCDKGYIGNYCTEKCLIDCVHGGCSTNGTHEKCNCDYKWTGEFCDERIPDVSNAWVWYTVGGCVGAVLVLFVVFIVLIYWMWKRREIIAMKIVHFFQPVEDSDGMLFDAFISYKSHPDDEEFVLKTLFPKLEKEMKFKLCLHFRDFVVGETIANNILWAVQNSRRTVLVISPNYLDSEFARFEYQTAQVETLRLRQRIIPIMFQDVQSKTDKMDRTLKNILETITYIKWSPETNEKENSKFWKRLVLSLPKRSDMEGSSKNSKTPVFSVISTKNESNQPPDSSVQLPSYKKLDKLEPEWTNLNGISKISA
ncbi:hypothetical protein SNE40_011574 [Patella caerulea]|uniref:Protein toll n=2 Tax=Patella caerulea TaxID=87958 RepID=A0AAN8JNR3_PATCE